MRRVEVLQNVLSVVAVTCAVVVTVLVVRREVRSDDSVPWVEVADVRPLLANPTHASGPRDARVAVVTFIDYQCSACRMQEAAIDSAVGAVDFGVLRVTRHLPLMQLHPEARDFALLSICLAGSDRFQEFVARAYAMQDVVAGEAVDVMLAVPVGSDTTTLRSCMRGDEAARVLSADLSLARAAGFTATPVTIIGSRRFVGAMPAEHLLREIRRASR